MLELYRYFLLDSRWLEDHRYPFLSQKDRMAYFEACLQPWMTPCWLLLGAGRMINVRWLYQETESADPSDQCLCSTLHGVLKERFLQLVDTTYVYIIARCDDNKSRESDLMDLGRQESVVPSIVRISGCTAHERLLTMRYRLKDSGNC